MTYRDIQTIEKHAEKTRFRNEPVVLVPLKDWSKIEELLEDAEMAQSAVYAKSIKQSRLQIKNGGVYALNLDTGKFKKIGKSKR